MTGKIAILGLHNEVVGFRPLGVETFEFASARDALGWLRQVALGPEAKRENYAVIFVTETLAEGMGDGLASLEREIDFIPCLVIIPGTIESKGLGWEAMRRVVRSAVGIDLLGSRPDLPTASPTTQSAKE